MNLLKPLNDVDLIFFLVILVLKIVQTHTYVHVRWEKVAVVDNANLLTRKRKNLMSESFMLPSI